MFSLVGERLLLHIEDRMACNLAILWAWLWAYLTLFIGVASQILQICKNIIREISLLDHSRKFSPAKISRYTVILGVYCNTLGVVSIVKGCLL